MKIAIMGAGAFGTALGGVLAERGCDIDYYDPMIEPEPLDKVLDGAAMILLAVPSKAVNEVLATLPKERPLIVATKGILNNAVFAEFDDYMVLSGPGFADDIKNHLPTKLTATDTRIIDMFTTDYLTFDFTRDERGVLMCGALKNVYAILAGLLDLQLGSEARASFLAEVAEEMRALLSANGADPKTVSLVCGVGDLDLTCAYPSRNFEFGQRLRENPNCRPDKTVEGLTTLEKIKNGEIVVPESARRLRELMQRI